MSVFRHKHVMVAVLVAPVLALGGYFAVGHFFGERPERALEGHSYPLVEKPNCRYDSGRCGLVNADFELAMRVRRVAGDQARLLLESAVPLDGVMVAQVGPESAEAAPAPMQATSGDGRRWQASIRTPLAGRDRLRVVASAAGAWYYGEVSTDFVRRPDDPAAPR